MSECPGISSEQMKKTNGCGSSFWLAYFFRLPRWYSEVLYCECCKHDLRYQDVQKIDIKYKKLADILLIKAAFQDALDSSRYIRWLKLGVADLMRWALSTKLSEMCWKAAKK